MTYPLNSRSLRFLASCVAALPQVMDAVLRWGAWRGGRGRSGAQAGQDWRAILLCGGWSWAIGPWWWGLGSKGSGPGESGGGLGAMGLKLGLTIGAIGLGLYVALALFVGFTQGRHIFFPEREPKQTPDDRGYAYESIKIPVLAAADPKMAAPPFLQGWWIPRPDRSPVAPSCCTADRADPASAPSPRPPSPPGSIVLFCHGNTGTLADNLHRVEDFHQLGLDVLLFDYRGYGHSTPTFPREDRVYGDARAAVDYLIQQRGVDPGQILVYGHSLGGAIAVETVVRSQLPFAGLVVEGSFTSILAMAHFTKKFHYLPLSLVLWQRFDNLAKVPQLRVPVLFVHGTADRTVPYFMSEDLYAAAPDPKSLALIPQVDHDITESENGEHLVILRQFLAEKARFTVSNQPSYR